MKALLALIALALLAVVGAAGFIYSGVYDIAATEQHLAPTYLIMDTAMRNSVRQRAVEIAVPPLDDPALVARGLTHYRAHCVQCHGAPGVAPEPFALGMTPAPASLVHTARAWLPADLFWVIKHGIKMTGMPAWTFRMPDEDIWAIVAFMQRLPTLAPAEYARLETQPLEHTHVDGDGAMPPDIERGKQAITQYACLTCHRIPGLVGAHAPVGPPLTGIGSRAVIAGLLPNKPENMVRWLREPQRVNPDSAMPDLGVSERDARDMAAYLYTLQSVQ